MAERNLDVVPSRRPSGLPNGRTYSLDKLEMAQTLGKLLQSAFCPPTCLWTKDLLFPANSALLSFLLVVKTVTWPELMHALSATHVYARIAFPLFEAQ